MPEQTLEMDNVHNRMLTLEIVRVTERAAVAAAKVRGRGDERLAEQAAVSAMRHELNRLPIVGHIVIGEGERDEAPMLYVGEAVGLGPGSGPKVDIALDPLEGTTIAAKDMPNSIAALALAGPGGLLKVPHVYMAKIAIGPGFPAGLVDLDMDPAEAVRALAAAKGVPVERITACILDRPRHAELIEAVRTTGAAIRLIGDGDVAGVIHTTEPLETGIDIYLGTGGAPEGVLAAAALRCTGGQMQSRLLIRSDEDKARARRMGIEDFGKKYELEEMAAGEVYFAATGVTDGNLLQGVKFRPDVIITHSVVMRSARNTIRWIRSHHTRVEKFDES
jgi:fructose-1,6-bisphosphatase II / sedoheptulose-1,7-bisphosphatase